MCCQQKYRLRGPKNRRPARWRAMRNRLTWQLGKGVTEREDPHPKGYQKPPDTPETYIKGEKLRNLYRVFSLGCFLGFNLGFMGWNWHVFPEKWMVGRQSGFIVGFCNFSGKDLKVLNFGGVTATLLLKHKGNTDRFPWTHHFGGGKRWYGFRECTEFCSCKEWLDKNI